MGKRPLTREEVKSVIEGNGAAHRVPMMVHFWAYPDTFGARKQEAAKLLSTYPNDINVIGIRIPDIFVAPKNAPSYRWVNFSKPENLETKGIDEQVAISDWDQLDDILADFPSPYYKGMFPFNSEDDGRYRLGLWWYCLFERLWSLRGMTNALMDFYLYPEKVHRLFRALTDFYKVMIERSREELNLDGILTSDDIGCQTGPFFSHGIFTEFFKPYYKEIIDKAHSVGMHFWLHACGNIEPFLQDFVDMGLDVIHPIQKYTMDEKVITQKYGSNICILAGFDVQRIIPYGTPDEVRQEVRFLVDTYYKPEGRLMLTAGNGITSDCKIESLEALLDESYNYGMKKSLPGK